jgi:hypothetical protein
MRNDIANPGASENGALPFLIAKKPFQMSRLFDFQNCEKALYMAPWLMPAACSDKLRRARFMHPA